MADEGLVLCFDYGLARIGVAKGATMLGEAEPLTIIHAKTKQARWAQIDALIETWDPDFLVIGVPYHEDGVPCEMTPVCQRFGRQLSARTRRYVYAVDERYSSAVVESRERYIDDEAAAVILDQFFLEPEHTRL